MMDGFLVVDKPAGLTSHDVVNRVRRLAGGRRVGHTGTLDPFATGVLPVAVGEATKAIQFLDESVKEYQATLRFGAETDTYDSTGVVVAEAATAGLTAEAVQSAMALFRGTIQQVPPMFSAIKLRGKPLYRLARQGVTVEREPRTVTIHRLEAARIETDEMDVFVSCSPGTYIRSLAFDLGRAIGCGAHLTALRRLRSGPFSLENAHSLDELMERNARGEVLPLIPLEHFLGHLQRLEIDEKTARGVRNGIRPSVKTGGERGIPGDSSAPVLLTHNGSAVAVAAWPHGGMEVEETLRLLRVFCDLSPLLSSGAMIQTQN
jgi:tRNA pseudouridine55 synthase